MKDSMPITPGQLKPTPTRGFSVTEVLVALAIIALGLGMVLPTSFFLIKSNVSLGNTTVMTTQARHLVEQLGTDIRSTVSITRNSERSLEVTTEDPDAKQSTILYIYEPQSNSLSRKVDNDRARTLIDDIVSLKFIYYNSQDLETSKLIDTKKIEVQVTQAIETMWGNSQTYEQKSTRFVLRNRVTPFG